MERLVSDLGGSYAFCDTDSMAIIASEQGGFLPCPGGTHSGADSSPGVRALPWREVEGIVGRLDALKPYGPEVRDSLLKLESENFVDGRQVQLYAYGISAKRYCLFRQSENGDPEIVRASEHGLGHLLNPTDPEERERGPSGAPKWIQDVWLSFVMRALGKSAAPLPAWFSRPAVARHGFTSPSLLRPLMRQQSHLPYAEQVKPFNFALMCYLAPAGAPEGTEPDTCHLIAAYESDAWKRSDQDWHDTASGTSCRIATQETTSPRVAQVKAVADILADYAAHPESKSAGPDGFPAGPQTIGLLTRRHVEPVYLFRLGKETNRLEEVEQGQIRTWEEVQEVYEHPRRMAWEEVYLPLLNALPIRQIEAETGIAESLLHRYGKGLVRPTPRQMKRLISCLRLHLDELAPVRGRSEQKRNRRTSADAYLVIPRPPDVAI